MDEHSHRPKPNDNKIDLNNLMNIKTEVMASFRMSFFVIGGYKQW